MNNKTLTLTIISLLILVIVVYLVVRFTSAQSGKAIVDVKVPRFSTSAQLGLSKFKANCASCHGVNAVGQKGIAPPLIHKIYEPSHHADNAFQRAVALGVRAHHWRFGNMPPIKGLSQADVDEIITYIRELQRANGIR